MALASIWALSLGLALLSIGTMLALIAKRAVLDRLEKAQADRRQKLASAMIAYLNRTGSRKTAADLASGKADLACDIALEIRELIQPEGFVRLQRLLASLDCLPREAKRLEARRPSERLVAARRLALLGRPAVLPLQRALQDPRAEIRAAAAQSLAELGAAPAPGLLAHKLDRLKVQSQLLRRAFRASVATHTAESIKLLQSWRITPQVAVYLIDGLGRTGAFEALPVLQSMLRHADADVRTAALRALASLGHPAAADGIVAALADADWVVRAQAAIAARRIGLASAAPHLERLLGDSEWWVRFRAAEALLAAGDDGRRRLERAASGDGEAASTARALLEERAR